MILNISGRTDIVAFYSEWLIKRFDAGFVDVRNPFNPKLVSRIELDKVNAIVFCTKNPIPIIKYLKQIKKPILFQVTLTPYKSDIEPGVVSKSAIIEAIKEVSSIVGIENIQVRYDPIFISEKYSVEYHLKAFDRLCSLLDGYVKEIITSFIDEYKNVRKNMKILNFRPFTNDDFKQIGEGFYKSASKYNMTVQTCTEEIRLLEYGFINQDCVTKEMAQRLTGKTKFKKWTARKNDNCNCVEMVDIGVYNTCSHFCRYCYANYDEKTVNLNRKNHNKNSSLLIGELMEDDIIKHRK